MSCGISNINLNFDGISEFEWELTQDGYVAKSISIQGNLDDEIRTYFFLHELGHYIIRNDYASFKLRFPSVHRAEYGRRMRDMLVDGYRVECLGEEYMAWEEGYLLADRLGIRINMRRWIYHRTVSLKGYIKYYSRKK